MQHTEVDHLVVAAASLAQADAWAQATLGLDLVAGGRHAAMGTHNRLLQLSDATWPRCYLELIAVDPAAQPPARPRWFGLDEPALQVRLAASGPELVAFVARSGMLDMHRWGLIHSQLQPGQPLTLSRPAAAGELKWQIVVPDDGRPLRGGAVPHLIQWQGPHPADSLPPSACRLQALTLHGLPARAVQVLRLRGVQQRAAVDGTRAPALSATLQTPKGAVVLESAG